MRINWKNIIGLLVVIFLVYLFFHARPFMEQFFEDSSGRWFWPDDPVWRFNIIGLLCLTAVAIAKALNR